MRVTAAFVVLALTACASTPAPAPVQQSVHATPPFTAEQIRDAAKEGDRYRYEVVSVGEREEHSWYETTYVAVSAEGATFEHRHLNADFEPAGDVQNFEVTWPELVSHARYPAELTTIEEGALQVPAGKFACKLYLVEDPSADPPMRKRIWFATELPGAPVRYEEVDADGKLRRSTTLIALIRGDGAK